MTALPLKRELSLENIFFQHDHDKDSYTLSDISFVIKSKATVAIVGPTGSGKSTLADIILGLIPPDMGTLKVDSQPLDESNISAWRMGVAHVPQSIFMADVSIAENIALGIPAPRN